MRFCVLGPVELEVARQRVVLTSDRQRAILAGLLVQAGEAVSADRLVDAVWGATPPPGARKSLHSHVSRLRRHLAMVDAGAAGTLVTEGARYRLDLDGHDLDASRFEALLGQARELRGREPARAVELLDEALRLWRGPAYGELAEREHILAEASRLEELRVQAAADRIDALVGVGRHTEVLGELEAVVATDPLNERAHAQLMLALYRSGRQADALAAYRRLQGRLVEELGIDPAPALQGLYEGILRQEPDLNPPASDTTRIDAGRVVTAHSPLGSSPPRMVGAVGQPELIGREHDVSAVISLITTMPLVTLTGPGGVGKTRLADAVTARVREEFGDGIGVCSLAAVRDPASLAGVIIDSLGIRPSGSASAHETVLTALGTRRLLLVLDSCEHLLESVSELVDRVRRHCPNVAILATSREYLHVPGERVWEVRPLRVPLEGSDRVRVAETPSGVLFCVRAQEVEPGFALTDDNAAAVAEICRRLDGVPLAIELAAARVRALAPSDLAERIDHRFRLLTAGPRREAGRHRTLEAVVDWSYELLAEDEARLFDRVSVFAGSFTLGAAEAVCADERVPQPDIGGLLAELVDKSMLASEHGRGDVRYRLLDTLRVYGGMRLEAAGDADGFRRAHAHHYVGLVERLAPAVRGPEERGAIAGIDAELDNLRVAHTWVVLDGNVDLALRLPVALHDYLHYRLSDEMVTWTERALELPGAREHRAFPAALATVARGAMNRGELARARDCAGVALAQAESDSLAILWALHVLTEVALYEGGLDEVLRLADRRDALARRLGDDYYRALADVSRVLAHLYGGAEEKALLHAVDARKAADVSGNQTARAWAQYASGEALLDAAPDQAAEFLEEAIENSRDVASRLTEGVALVSLASLLGRRGETGRALELFRDAIAHWRTLGDHTHQLTTLRNLVELLARAEPDEATAVLHGAVTAGANPSFGAEADRLAGAWSHLERRLGAPASAAAERGRRMTLAQTVDQALVHLDAVLDG